MGGGEDADREGRAGASLAAFRRSLRSCLSCVSKAWALVENAEWMKKSAVAVLHARLRKPTHTGPAEPRPINMWASTCGPLSNRCSLHRLIASLWLRAFVAQRTLHAVSKVYALPYIVLMFSRVHTTTSTNRALIVLIV